MDTPKFTVRPPVYPKDRRRLAVLEARLRHEILSVDDRLELKDRVVKLRRRLEP